VGTIVQLAEVVKFGAASLGSNNPEAQVMLINAVKDVATALGDLIHATKSASGKGIDHPSMNHLKDSAKVRRAFFLHIVVCLFSIVHCALDSFDLSLNFLFLFLFTNKLRSTILLHQHSFLINHWM